MSGQQRRTVLAVADDADALAELVAALDGAGYRAVPVAGGEVATLLRAFRFALIVADAGSAFGDGDGAAAHREALEGLRGLAGDIPLLVVPARDPARLRALIAPVGLVSLDAPR